MSELLVLILGVIIGWIVPCPHRLQIGINKGVGFLRDKVNFFK